jgi:hypothetical protein
MKRLAGLALALLVGVLGAGLQAGCSADPYAPYDFTRVPGYTPPGGISSPERITKIRLESQR